MPRQIPNRFANNALRRSMLVVRLAGASLASSRLSIGGTMKYQRPVYSILTATLCAFFALAFQARAQEVPSDYQDVLKTLAKQGDFKTNVLKVNITRKDVTVIVDGVATPTPFGFGGWLAMTKGDGGMDVMMGDLVLTQDEVTPVMSALLDNGLDVTALHNHFLWEEPRIFYMHVHGHGKPADLARKVKPAVDLIGKGSSRTAAQPSPAGSPATSI